MANKVKSGLVKGEIKESNRSRKLYKAIGSTYK